MHLSNWLLFCSVALLVTFSPGPAVLLAISNAIAVGPRRAMISSMGNGFVVLRNTRNNRGQTTILK